MAQPATTACLVGLAITLFYPSLGVDTLNGGVGGTNTINFSLATAAVTVNLTAGTASGWGTDALSNYGDVIVRAMATR